MSAAASTPAILSQPGDNQFQLHDHENKTQITLNLAASGPIVVGLPAPGPTLQYEGAEGTHSFSGDQIVSETNVLGSMYTVTLNIVPDLRTLSFTLILPSVTHKTARQAFDTIAIKSEHHTSLLGAPTVAGANVTYSVMKMHGTAQKVEVAQ